MNQSSLMSYDSINGDNIRKTWHNGEWYYSLIDVIAEMLEINYKRAQTY